MFLESGTKSITPQQFEFGLNQLGANFDDLFRRKAEMKWDSSFWGRIVFGQFADLPKPWRDMLIGSQRSN